MALKFITGNKRKFEEMQILLMPIEVERIDIELLEIQSLDAEEVMRQKLAQAMAYENGELIIEDTSVYFECFDYKLPGPFIKWFLESQGVERLVEIANKLGLTRARAKSLVGYAYAGQMQIFQGVNEGSIVPARGEKDFGWGPIFLPDGHDSTFGEMEREEKYEISMRGIAARKLKDFLLKNH